MIPDFRKDGYLPEGLHFATEAEITFRFGGSSRKRRYLIRRVREWIELARLVFAHRLLLDGSFVTSKLEPHDVDAVILLPRDFQDQITQSLDPALELQMMLLSRQPEELFAAEDELDCKDWQSFFERTRESDGRKNGLVEVNL